MGRRKCRNRKRRIQSKMLEPAAAASSSAPPPEAPSPSEPPPPPWIELPGDVTANILQRLGAEEILMSVQQVCTTWWKVCQDPAMWRVIYLCNPDPDPFLGQEYTVMCRRAVDLSQGQLVDLTIAHFGNDELMEHIADRSRYLKRLKLGSYYMSGASLLPAVAKLRQLEELHLNIMSGIFADDIETIGNSCPKLKSFSYNERGSKHRLPTELENDDIIEGSDRNDCALAIGKSMPNLRHLQLFAHWMQNEGLEAILNGCPHLESLDIRQCFYLDLGGDLGKRCREQIKDLRLPNDSISDVSWLVGKPFEWDGSDSFDSACYFSDYDYYNEDYECYDDYFSPLGYGFFNGDGPGFFDSNYF